MEYDFSVHSPVNSIRTTVPQQKNNITNTDDIVERRILYGTDITKSEIPRKSILEEYKIAFQDNYGRTFGLSETLLSKHLLLLGGIGCGKTNVFNFIIESLLKRMTNDDVMIIFDTKGDFKDRFYQANTHWLIGNHSMYDTISRSWNVFEELKEENGYFGKESELTAKEIAKQLFKGRESESQPFFAHAAADLVAKVMIHLMRKATKTHTEYMLHTKKLVEFLQSADVKKYYDMTMDPDNKDFISAQLYFGNPNEKLTAQALGVFGYINSMVNDLFVGVFAEPRRMGNFAMRKIVREKGKKIVFVEYDMSMGETLGPMYRLMLDLALKEALGGRKKQRGNTYFIIDEFKLLPDLLHIEDALNFGRSLGVKICAGLQSINQLYEIYGEDRGKVLLAGFMNSFCFQTWDVDSRKFIMDRFGETYENIAFRSRTVPVTTQKTGHVVEDWDILGLNIGEAFVNLVGYPPFSFQFADFDKPHIIL